MIEQMKTKGVHRRIPATLAVGLLLAAVLQAATGCTAKAPDGGGGIDNGPTGGTCPGGCPPTLAVAISAAPARGTVNQPVAFTASISGGSPPYRTCSWTFGGAPEAGTIAAATCTLSHTFTRPESAANVTVEVGDGIQVAKGGLSYTVTDGTTPSPSGSSPPPPPPDAGGVDLLVRDIALVAPPPGSRYAPGQDLRFSFKVQNTGSVGAPASVARAFLRNAANQDTLLGDTAVAAVGAGAEQLASGSVKVPAGQAAGPYGLKIVVDARSEIAESNETNNEGIAAGVLTVQAAADGGM